MNFLLESTCNEQNNRWDVVLTGEIDIFNSSEMKKQLLALIEQKKLNLSLDCKNLEYIDSTALGSLVAVLKNVKSYNGEIYLKHLRPNLTRLFKITNLDKVMIIEGDANE